MADAKKVSRNLKKSQGATRKESSRSPASSRPSEIHIEFKYLVIVILAAMISYVAYYLKYPSTWAAILNLALIVLILVDYKNADGFKVIIYAMILSILSLPVTVFSMAVPLAYQLVIFALNIVLMVFITLGVKQLRKWGFYLALAVFALSILSLVMQLVPLFSQFSQGQFFITTLAKQFFSMVFYGLAIGYLVVNRRYFGIAAGR